ncbi:MAG: phage integrase N-terminal SAM-like domain-containing protein [Candidatus Binatia bacterium]
MQPARDNSPPSIPPKPKLLDQVRQAIRTRHYSYMTEKAYVGWTKRFIFFHNKRHPAEMGETEIARFLSSLATNSHVSSSTQNQAFNALLFLYGEVLQRKIGLIAGVIRAKKPKRLPVVLTKEEVKRILDCFRGTPWLMAMLLYGAGLRLLECCHLRVKDIDFSRNQIVVRAGKGRRRSQRLGLWPFFRRKAWDWLLHQPVSLKARANGGWKAIGVRPFFIDNL